MVNEILRFRIAIARTMAFLDACREVERRLRLSEHCLSYELARCAEEPQDFILMIGWDSLNRSLKEFDEYRVMQPFLKSVQKFSADIFETRRYERVHLAVCEAA